MDTLTNVMLRLEIDLKLYNFSKTKEFSTEDHDKFEILLLEAETKESLDSVSANKKLIKNINS